MGDEWLNTNNLPPAVEVTLYLKPLDEHEPPIEMKRYVRIPVVPDVRIPVNSDTRNPVPPLVLPIRQHLAWGSPGL